MKLKYALAICCMLASCSDKEAGSGYQTASTNGFSTPTREELLAAVPDGHIYVSTDIPDIQVHGKLPSFLFGTQPQVAYGVSKPVPNPPEGTPVHRWGLWHYFYEDVNGTGDPYSWTCLAQRGSFEDGNRIGKWTMWYPDGSKRGEGEFADNLMTGEWSIWTPTGDLDLQNSGQYLNGMKAK
ncbi:MAG: hypothetical protein GY930_17240 [bacterium]|nr:hypothetical protein [bacterium]